MKIRLKSHSKNVSGTVRLKGADGWRITPPSGVPFTLAAKYEESDVSFEIAPPKNARETVLTAEADLGAGGFVEVQGTAEGAPFTRAELDALLALADKGIRQLVAAQKQALGLG